MVCDYAMLCRLDSGITKCLYTNPPRPRRPLTDRDVFIVQDYVRVTNRNDGGTIDESWFYTYNHDVAHPYFAPRSGFVRAKMKYQGMVGVLGDGGKTRLTWLANMDFGGSVPGSFMNAILVNYMVFPISTVEETKRYLLETEGNMTAVTSSAALEDVTSAAAKSKRDDVAVELELTDLKAKFAEMKVEMERKDEEYQSELAGKDEKHQSELAGKDDELKKKDEQIMELRKRLSRVVVRD